MYKSFSSRNVQTQLQQCAASQQKANASTSTADNKSKKKRGQPLLNCASGRLLHEQSQQRQKEAQQKQQKQSISKQRDAFESFFGAILECAASLYLEAAQVEAASDSTKPLLLWKLLCHLLGVPHIPLHNKPLPTKYSSATKYFSHRAALVVEEARYVIGEGLLQYWNNNGNKHKTSALPNKNNHANAVKVKLLEVKEVTQKQLMNMTFQLDNTRVYSKAQWDPFRRPGTIVQCIPIRSGSSTRMEDTILGCVGNRSSGGEDGELHQFHMMTSSSYYLIANKNKNNNADEWLVVPLTTLLSQCRQWESLQCSGQHVASGSNAVYQLPFEALLLGRHGNKDNNTSKEQQSSCVNTIVGGRTEDEDHTIADGDGDLIDLTVDIATTGDWNLPALNERQEEVVRSFLKSPKGSITLTQGPPGTGKTLLLVTLMGRYLQQQQQSQQQSTPQRPLMVSAPTNKAVTVLATRYMEIIGQYAPHIKVILVGDADKLVGDDDASTTKNTNRYSNSGMKSMFIYSFWSNVSQELSAWKRSLLQSNRSNTKKSSSPPYNKTTLLRLLYQAADVLTNKGQNKLCSNLIQALQSNKQLDNYPTKQRELFDNIEQLKANVTSLENDSNSRKGRDILRSLLRHAHVIFCTLASSGSSLFKGLHVGDLIVDEAAAATEPELAIPFRLQPSRLCAVGDPQQLPATVSSPVAQNMGLPQSLHHRLMYDCQYNYIMLNKQYRMTRSISSFPSQHFYDGELKNSSQVKSSNYVSPRPLLQNQQSWLFQHVEGKEERRHGSSSFCNKAEAKAVVDWLKQLRYKSSDTDWCSPERVRVITFYQGQVALIKELLRKEGLGRVLVATVDSSQGCEADLVIISFVRTCASLSSSPSSSSSSSGSGSTTSSINRTAAGEDESTTFTGKNRKNVAGFLTDDRRINVALTRAKFELICIGNRKNMSRNDNLPTLQKLAQDAENRGVTEGARPCDDHKARKKEKKRLKKDSKRSNKDNKMQQQQNDGDNDSNDGTVISPSSSVKENCYEDNRKRKEYGDAPGQEVEDVKRQKQHGSDNAGAAVLHPVMY